MDANRSVLECWETDGGMLMEGLEAKIEVFYSEDSVVS